MRKLILASFLVLGTLAMNAQEVSDQQWSLVTKKTADWCPFCGQWGWTFKNNITEDQQDKPVVVWAAHHSGGLETPTSSAIIANIPSSGQPVFFINNDNMGVFSSNISAKRDEFNILLESLSSFEPFGGVGSTAVFDGEKITNTAKAKFFVDLEGGDYWLASYLVDDVLVAYQSSQGSNAEHTGILMHSFNGTNYFGESIQNGSVTANQEFLVEGELDFSGDNNIPDYSDGYSVVTILWARLPDGEYTTVNLNKQPVTGAVSTEDVLNDVDITAFHTTGGQIDLSIESGIALDNVQVNLFDINGRTISTLNSINLVSGTNRLSLDTQELTLGTYIVNINSDKGSRSIKVSVR